MKSCYSAGKKSGITNVSASQGKGANSTGAKASGGTKNKINRMGDPKGAAAFTHGGKK
jgi:hypothetical protein